MRAEIVMLFLGMACVTYIPRALPALVMDRLRLPPRAVKFLQLIPVTAMTALVFPAVLDIDAARPLPGIAGALTAGLLAWRRAPLILCVLAAIAADALVYLILGCA